MRHYFIKRFIKHFARGDNWHELDLKAGNLGYGLVHYGLLRLIKPERVLVIGSQYGFVPAICALAMRDNKKGVVEFVDAGFDMIKNPYSKNHWGGVGFWRKVDVDKHFSKFKLSKYIRFYLMTSDEFAKGNLKKKWDYVYLDGDHSYKGVKGDFDRFWPRLNKGGYLGLHDIYVKRLGGLDYGVIRLWRELKKQGLTCLSFPGKHGLGLVKK